MQRKHIPTLPAVTWLTVDINRQPAATQLRIDIKHQNCTPFWNLHTLKCKENTFLQSMNINLQPAATQLRIDIKHRNCSPFWNLHTLKCKENTPTVYEYQSSTSSLLVDD